MTRIGHVQLMTWETFFSLCAVMLVNPSDMNILISALVIKADLSYQDRGSQELMTVP
jgi:hypothetical protein